MRKLFLPVVLVMLYSLTVTYGQLIDGLDGTATDTTYKVVTEGDASYMNLSQNSSDKQEGSSSLQIKAVVGAYHGWGSNTQLQKRIPTGLPLENWSISDSLAIWIKVIEAPVIPANVVFRIHIADQPTPEDNIEEYIYEHTTILDEVHDWVELKLSLKERWQDGNVIPNDSGFVLFPKIAWGGGQYNNEKLDYDKIVGWNISMITTGWNPDANLPADSLTMLVDGFRRYGLKSVPLIIFNGVDWAGNISTFTWGQSALSVETGAGTVPGTNAIKWVQGDEWSNGWTGMGANIAPAWNLGGSWPQDSVKFKLKAEEGVGALRVQFESGGAKVGTVFTPTADNQWHDYALALREMVPQDNTTDFDSTNVTVIGFMAEASAVAGKVIYLTDVWTGNPEFDVIAPAAPTSITAIAGSFQNLVTWTDVPDEANERYDVYYSTQPITDISAPGVESAKVDVFENTQLIEHLLKAPVTDQSVTYYYAVVCRDGAGNVGPVSTSSASVTNDAKGIVTVSLSAPTATFVADGNPQEWQGITPISMSSTNGTGFVAPNTIISNDADLNAKIYLAVDADYLYVAFDMEDDVVSPDISSDSWMNDAPDLFIGLYDWHGKSHKNYQRGEQPDYHFRFNKAKAIIDGGGVARGDSLLIPGENYFWGEKFPTGYIVEARISLQDLAERGSDSKFVPVEGMRLPLDFSLNDADGAPREGILCYSPFNEDQSYQTPSRWMYTWIGNAWTVGVEDDELVADSYDLLQNYPNPFNPATQISYSLKEAGFVTLKIYDMLGREVATLINGNQESGIHNLNFDAGSLASGMYLYRIDAGKFQSTKKMMLLK